MLAAALALPVVALALPAVASAGQPFVIDPNGRKPHVAVAENGTGHFVWEVDTGGTTIGADEVRYCQVPRGATACTRTHRFEGARGGPYNEGPRTLLHRDGRVIIIGEQSGLDQVAIVSSDGGNTFAAPRAIGTFRPATIPSGFRAELGPGEGTVSMLIGGLFQAAPLDGTPSSEYADLGPQLTGGLAFIDPLTPIVALEGFDTITFRRYDGSGNHNASANWTPPKAVGPGNHPDLTGGLSGVYLSYVTGAGQLIRRYDQSGDSFGPAQLISGEGGGETRAGDLHQSAGGSLHQTWSRTGDAPLEHRRSLDGGSSWLPMETLAVDPASGFFDQHVATGSDGGGFAVWSDATSNSVRAVAIVTNSEASRPSGTGQEPCRVQVGIAVAIAREGCFQREGSLYRAPGEVRINGIDLGGQGKIAIDVRDRSLKTSGPVTATVGNVALGTERLDWRIPAGEGTIKDSAGNEATFDAAKANSAVLALLVSGWTTPRIVKGEAVELPVHLELPAPLSTLLSDKATGSVTLRASNARSLELANATIDVKDVSIGIAEIERFNLVYQNLDPWVLHGSTAIRLPVAALGIKTDFGFKGGDFDFARGEVRFADPGRQLATLVFLRQIRFDTNNRDGCKTPAKIAGGVILTLISEQISRVEGDAFYKFPLGSCKQPGVFRIEGKGFLRDLQVADMYAQYVTPGTVTFGGGADVTTSLISVGLRVDGSIDVPTETFFVEGKVGAGTISDPGAKDDPKTEQNEARPPQRKEIIGAGVIVSSIGLRVCAEFAGGWLKAGYGFHQRWGEDDAPVPDWPFFEGCEGEAEDFKPAGFRSGAASRSLVRASQAGSGFRVERGVPFVNLRIEGPGGPQVVVRGPGGRTVRTRAGAPELTRSHAFAVRPEENRTFVRIFKPRRGRWIVIPQRGSTITRVLRANGLPKPEVRVVVKRERRGMRLLTWRLRRLPGQRVRLFERGRGEGMHAIRTVSRRRGRLRFRPAPGLGRLREVVALVESRGFPRERLTVARFRAPEERLPSRPRRVTLKRSRGNRLVVRWSRASATNRHAVHLRLRDGRSVTHVTRKRELIVGDVPAIDGGTVTVAGLRADNVAGPAARARLRPNPKLQLAANRRQRLSTLAVVVGCGAQACDVRASGTVKVKGEARRFELQPATAKIAAGERKTLRLRATRSARRELIRLLKRGRRARATLAVRPPGAGRTAAERVLVRLEP